MRRILKYILKYLAKAIVWRTKPLVVGVTGSVGKSSTKEAIAAVLEQCWAGRVRKSERNLNTEIGVPLTIIGGRDARKNIVLWIFNILKGVLVFLLPLGYPRVLVLEMAADKPGDISYLATIAPPHIAVVTAIGDMPVHVEQYSSREELIAEKEALVRAVFSGGTVVLNADDAAAWQMRRQAPAGAVVVSYGVSDEADFRAQGAETAVIENSPEPHITTRYKLVHEGSIVPFELRGRIDRGALYAALAATAVGSSMGVNLVSIAEVLEEGDMLTQRMQLRKGIKETLIIDDSYNAAPLSTDAALEALALFSSRRRIAVLGDMRELGPYTETAHRTIGDTAARVADTVFFVGAAMRFAAEQAKKSSADVHWFKTSKDAAPIVQDILQPRDVVLVKGSRSLHMENIVEEVIKR